MPFHICWAALTYKSDQYAYLQAAEYLCRVFVSWCVVPSVLSEAAVSCVRLEERRAKLLTVIWSC